jgi:hypothetical protein
VASPVEAIEAIEVCEVPIRRHGDAVQGLQQMHLVRSHVRVLSESTRIARKPTSGAILKIYECYTNNEVIGDNQVKSPMTYKSLTSFIISVTQKFFYNLITN